MAQKEIQTNANKGADDIPPQEPKLLKLWETATKFTMMQAYEKIRELQVLESHSAYAMFLVTARKGCHTEYFDLAVATKTYCWLYLPKQIKHDGRMVTLKRGDTEVPGLFIRAVEPIEGTGKRLFTRYEFEVGKPVKVKIEHAMFALGEYDGALAEWCYMPVYEKNNDQTVIGTM